MEHDQSSTLMLEKHVTDVRKLFAVDRKVLGRGEHGIVRRCVHRGTKKLYAIKTLRKTDIKRKEYIIREAKILQFINHPHIVQGVHTAEDDKFIHFVMELLINVSLCDRVIENTTNEKGPFTENETISYLRDILGAVSYLHNNGIAHRDIKPENFLFKTTDHGETIKLVDFGLSRSFTDCEDGFMNTTVGTPLYVAPEVLNKKYRSTCDEWSIGVLTYLLLCGYTPFHGESVAKIIQNVRRAEFNFHPKHWYGISETAKEFICALIQTDISKRMTVDDALQHSWFLLNK